MYKPALLVLLLVSAASVRAQSGASAYGKSQTPATTCPWLTAGTAARLLGGDVAANLSVSGVTEGTCHFARSGDTMRFIEIRVSAALLPDCPTGSWPLRGIGNEAQQCRVALPRGGSEEMVSGRVRDLHFTVVIAGHRDKLSSKSPDSADDDVVRIADEVAGNLY
jgi:hypothetical protein